MGRVEGGESNRVRFVGDHAGPADAGLHDLDGGNQGSKPLRHGLEVAPTARIGGLASIGLPAEGAMGVSGIGHGWEVR